MYGYDVYDFTVLIPFPPEFIVCQAFRDDAGKFPIGKSFIKAPPGTQQFFQSSISPISVGSIFCSDAASVRAYVTSRPPDGVPVVEATPLPYVGVFFNFPSVEPGGGPFNLQYVLLDNSIKPLVLSNNETEAFIFAQSLREAVEVSCQLYADKQASKKIGNLITENQTFLTEDKNYAASKVKAIRCKTGKKLVFS